MNAPVKPKAMKAGATALAVPETNALTTSADLSTLPAWMQQDIGAGKDNIGSDDIEVPRLKLLQALSPELDTYDTARAGMFFHTSQEHLFTKPFRAVPIFMDRRYILWNPRNSGGGILARADDGVHWKPANREFTVKLDKKDGGGTVVWRTKNTVEESGLAEWGSANPEDMDSAPAATLMYSYVLAFPDNPELMPAVITFQRSSIRVGKRFNTKLKTTRAPMFGLVFQFGAIKDKNGAGEEFHNIEITGAGRIDDQGQYLKYKALHQDFAQTGVQIKDLETAQDDQYEVPTDAADNAAEETVTSASGKTRPRI